MAANDRDTTVRHAAWTNAARCWDCCRVGRVESSDLCSDKGAVVGADVDAKGVLASLSSLGVLVLFARQLAAWVSTRLQ